MGRNFKKLGDPSNVGANTPLWAMYIQYIYYVYIILSSRKNLIVCVPIYYFM